MMCLYDCMWYFGMAVYMDVDLFLYIYDIVTLIPQIVWLGVTDFDTYRCGCTRYGGKWPWPVQVCRLASQELDVPLARVYVRVVWVCWMDGWNIQGCMLGGHALTAADALAPKEGWVRCAR